MSDTTPYPRKTVSAIIAALAGSIAAAVITLSIGGGTVITKHLRTTVSIDPQSIAANSATTTAVALTGATVGDHVSLAVTAGDLMGTTSTAVLAGRVTASDVVTIYYRNVSSTAFDAGLSTISVQTWKY